MSVGLVLVTHPGIASALLQQARQIVGDELAGVETLEVYDRRNGAGRQLAETLERVDGGAGVLILTDLPGATPANLAVATCTEGCRVVSGVNLAMLIRVWNYRDRPIAELTALAVDGGRKAIMEIN